MIGQRYTGARVIRLHIHRRDLAVLDEQGIPFGSIAAENGRAVERQVECLGILASRIGEESDLCRRSIEHSHPL